MQAKAKTIARAGKLLGYARVSTTDQNLTLQREALAKAGVSTVFEESKSGTKIAGRTELAKLLSVLGPGDTIVVTRLDRLGRSLRDLANIAHQLDEVGAHLRVIEQSVDTSTSAGRAFFGMLAVFAQFETDVRRERQMEGIVKAKGEGKYRGAVPRLDRAKVAELHALGVPKTRIAKQLGMARSSVHRLIDEVQNEARRIAEQTDV